MTDRQTDRQTVVPWRSAPPSIERDRDRDRKTDRQTDRQNNRQTEITWRSVPPSRERKRERKRERETSKPVIVMRTTKIYISIYFFS